MRVVTLAIAAAAVIILGMTVPSAQSQQTHVGVVTDTMCGANHAMMNVKPDSKCVTECVGDGKRVKYALLEGSNVYTLSDQQTPAKFAAQKVKVTGVLDAKTKTLNVQKIEAVK